MCDVPRQEGGPMMNMPIVVLSNGLRVGNFSSPHDFVFEDGSVLPRCSDERVKAGSVEAEFQTEDRGVWSDIVGMKDRPTEECDKLLSEAVALWDEGKVDLVIVPRRLLDAIKMFGALGLSMADSSDSYGHPFRTGRLTPDGRINKIHHIDLFCA
jgi:hypothetical protein